MARRKARSSTNDSASHMQRRGRTDSPASTTRRRAQSPTLAAGAVFAMNNARVHGFPSLSPERRVEDHLGRGMREATRQARGPKSILQRLLAFHAGQQGGRLGVTSEEVYNTVASVLGTAKLATHEILSIGVNLLEFAPVPGLTSVGETLLSIWEAVEEVQANRRACERLAEQCAVIVSFVREEVYDTTGFVSEDLKPSVAKLNRALREVEAFIREQALQTCTHEFLSRRSIKPRVEEIQVHLTQAFQLFNYAIPVQILHFLQREIHPAAKHHGPEATAPAVPQPHSSREMQQPPHSAPRMEPTVLEVTHTCTGPAMLESTHKRPAADTARPTIVHVDRGYGASSVAHPNAPANGHAMSAPAAKPPPDPGNKQLDIPRLYARLVQHDFESLLLTMPLWTPTPVSIGAVGYYSRADGGFVTLFDAHAPLDIAGIPALSQYGSVEAYQPKPTSCAGRPHTFALQADSPAAYLYTENTAYRCFNNLQGPENWMLENADKIIAFFRGKHPIDRKRLILVTGTMAAPDHALCVCPNPPRSNGTITFHRRKAKPGQPWGEWSQKPVPDGAEPVVSKMSTVKAAHEPWDAVFLSVLSYHRLVDEGAQ